MKLLKRLPVLIIGSWLGGWATYGLSLWLLYHESPFHHDVYVVGFWSLLYGLPFGLLVIVPSLLGLRRVCKRSLSGGVLSLIACCLSFGYMSLLFGLPMSPERVLFHLFAAASSFLFGQGFSWAVAGQSERP